MAAPSSGSGGPRFCVASSSSPRTRADLHALTLQLALMRLYHQCVRLHSDLLDTLMETCCLWDTLSVPGGLLCTILRHNCLYYQSSACLLGSFGLSGSWRNHLFESFSVRGTLWLCLLPRTWRSTLKLSTLRSSALTSVVHSLADKCCLKWNTYVNHMAEVTDANLLATPANLRRKWRTQICTRHSRN